MWMELRRRKRKRGRKSKWGNMVRMGEKAQEEAEEKEQEEGEKKKKEEGQNSVDGRKGT